MSLLLRGDVGLFAALALCLSGAWLGWYSALACVVLVVAWGAERFNAYRLSSSAELAERVERLSARIANLEARRK